MSWSLVNRGLELFDSDLPDTGSGKKSEGKSKSDKVETQRHGVQKAARLRKQVQQKKTEAKKQLIQKQVASAIEEYSKNANIDRTKDNLKLLKKIDRKTAPTEFVSQILEHHNKELERKGVNRELALLGEKARRNKKEGETSVFSDEDFERLNKEWLRLY
ncbi:hypothetical protein Pcinc_041643 [Petrolisthes cinctipes]|uniref:Active regulator of SIRT1 n=1 Tax=Petrolisthes cinctipes TaxID=88211 RepID=A0AAE1EGR6_PETCI|nr:hypothetical protein Pcinc_041643 [Petrolisthes cinctipes]